MTKKERDRGSESEKERKGDKGIERGNESERERERERESLMRFEILNWLPLIYNFII